MQPAGELLLLLGKLGFFAAGAAAGARSLRLARAESGLGQHSLAAAAIVIGSLGLVLFPMASVVGPGALRAAVGITGEVFLRIGFALLSVFVWRVFRPESGFARALAACCLAALVGTLVWELIAQDMAAGHSPARASAWAAQISFMLPFVWSSIESGLEWRRARRRVAIGIGDPAAANGFALWSIATASLATICVLANAVAWSAAHGHDEAAALLLGLRGLLYWPAVVAVWLGFFQPSWYRRRWTAAAAA